VNISQFRCDALVLISDRPDLGTTRINLVPLPMLTSSKAQEWAMSLLNQTRERSEQEWEHADRVFDRFLPNLLKNLRKCVVEPVMNAFGDTLPSLKRVWWCPTGPLAHLPLHATGILPSSRDISHPVMSYTPTLSALIRSRRPRPPPESSGGARILAVGYSDPSGPRPLQKVSGELGIFNQLPSQFTAVKLLEGPTAQCSSVLVALPDHEWAHVACHASQDSVEPCNSHFRLCDGDLKLSSILQMRLERSTFVYLSACEGATGVNHSSDEAIHLAAGLQFAGFRGAIATLWAVRDTLAMDIAQAFYKHLCKNKAQMPSAAYAATALDEAKRELVSRKISPLKLVPYVHIGM
jgi:CHAT domain-containing protein